MKQHVPPKEYKTKAEVDEALRRDEAMVEEGLRQHKLAEDVKRAETKMEDG